MHESYLTGKILEALNNAFGGVWIKLHGSEYQPRGLPDIIGIRFGIFVGMEVKIPGNEGGLEKTQKMWIRKINQAGGKACMVTSVEEALKFVSQIKPNGERR